MLIFDVISISFMKGVKTPGRLGDNERDIVPWWFVKSSSSVPVCPGLKKRSPVVESGYGKPPLVTVGLASRMRLYWTGVYLSKLLSRRLGGGFLELNVLGLVGVDIRERDAGWSKGVVDW